MAPVTFGTTHRFNLGVLDSNKREAARQDLLNAFGGPGLQSFQGERIFVTPGAQKPDEVTIATRETCNEDVDADIALSGMDAMKLTERQERPTDQVAYFYNPFGSFEESKLPDRMRHKLPDALKARRDEEHVGVVGEWNTTHYYTRDGQHYLGSHNPDVTTDGDVYLDTYYQRDGYLRRGNPDV